MWIHCKYMGQMSKNTCTIHKSITAGIIRFAVQHLRYKTHFLTSGIFSRLQVLSITLLSHITHQNNAIIRLF